MMEELMQFVLQHRIGIVLITGTIFAVYFVIVNRNQLLYNSSNPPSENEE
ncbi:hypothetical protein [Paenibacillus turpanensis]|nr:hypothetical protein [Paenibacillus turpanensis]